MSSAAATVVPYQPARRTLLPLVGMRLIYGLITVWLVATIVFVTTEILPGDVAAAVLGQDATAESLAAMRERLGLDRPAATRYAAWLWDMARGDFGASLASGRQIAPLIEERLWNTGRLALAAALIAIPTALALGLLSAVWSGSIADRAIGLLALGAISVPEFFVGLALVWVFAVQLGWLPSIALVRPGQSLDAFLTAIALPAATLAAGVMPHIIRLTRSALLAALVRPYVETAVLKGVPRAAIVARHALPNALGPIISIVGLVAAYLVAGVVVVETLFAYPGIGRLIVDSVAVKDMTVVQACALVLAAVYVVVNAAADALALAANPRLRAPS